MLLLKGPLLSSRVGEQSFSEFIQSSPLTTCFKLDDLLVWEIPDAEIAAVRRALSKAGMLIALVREESA